MNIKSIIGICTFVFGIVANEILLMAQGVAGLKYESIPYANEMLLIAALRMFIGILLFVLGQLQRIQKTTD